MKKPALILAAAACLALAPLPQASASGLTQGLHAVDNTVAHAIGAKKCRDMRERHWSHRSHRWVWVTTRVCHRAR